MKRFYISVLIIFYSLQSFSSSINGKSLICSAKYDFSKFPVISLIAFYFYENRFDQNTFDQYILNDTKNDDKKFHFIKYEDKLPHYYIISDDTIELNFIDQHANYDSIFIDRFSLEITSLFNNYTLNFHGIKSSCKVHDNHSSFKYILKQIFMI